MFHWGKVSTKWSEAIHEFSAQSNALCIPTIVFSMTTVSYNVMHVWGKLVCSNWNVVSFPQSCSRIPEDLPSQTTHHQGNGCYQGTCNNGQRAITLTYCIAIEPAEQVYLVSLSIVILVKPL